VKKISLKNLKSALSKIAEVVAGGQIVEVTKYNKPFIYLFPASHPSLHFGQKLGQNQFEQLNCALPKGKLQKILSEDRDG
jgi:antitoxin (DNA-binding transcriptional repressor) of toxin-antitoxin stability system